MFSAKQFEPDFTVKVMGIGLSGLSKLIDENDFQRNRFRAPELWVSGAKATEKADVYSFGLLLWTILTRSSEGPFSQYRSLEVKDLVTHCTHTEPGTREADW